MFGKKKHKNTIHEPTIFRWKKLPSHSLPFFYFIFLALIAHILFFHLFFIPVQNKKRATTSIGTLFVINNQIDPYVKDSLHKLTWNNLIISRGQAETDPLTKGIDQQIKQPLHAGVFNWNPTPQRYPDFIPPSHAKINIGWNTAYPPYSSRLNVETPKPQQLSSIVIPHIIDASDTLKERLLSAHYATPPENENLNGSIFYFYIVIDPNGQVTSCTPDKTGNTEGLEMTAQWIRHLIWSKNTEETSGIITIEWKRHV